MTIALERLRPRRYYDMQPDGEDRHLIRLSGCEASFGKSAWASYCELMQMLHRKDLDLKGVECAKPSFLSQLRQNGLVYDLADIPRNLSGTCFHDEHFAPVLTAWLHKAFSHKFWDTMMNGEGSARLYAGWLFELYHYTRNANRHMPLAAAHCPSKEIKKLFAQHYYEEWNHFHFFARALKALGYSKEAVEASKPLPMTMEMSNFMRQAARRDSLAYAICSAVLEGTTVDRQSFNPFYEAVKSQYGVPDEAVRPIYDHLDLDAKYQHSHLFRDICDHCEVIDAERASLVLSYGHQMVEHIWMWTENIWSYYSDPQSSLPRRPFDIYRD